MPDKIALNTSFRLMELETFNKMLDAFEDNDDVQQVYHNVVLPEEEEEE